MSEQQRARWASGPVTAPGPRSGREGATTSSTVTRSFYTGCGSGSWPHGLRRVCAIVVAMIFLSAEPGLATVGGPELLDVWGWDAMRQGVMIQVDRRDGGSRFGPVVLMRPGRPDSVIHLTGCTYWEDPGVPDSECERAIVRLRAGLETLAPLSLPSQRLPFNTRVVRRDSVTTLFNGHPRFLVEARFDWAVLFRVTTYYRTEVVLVARYPLPDRETDLVVLSFFGTGFEGGYETWVPVFVPRLGDPPYTDERSTVVEVEWRPHR